MPLKLNRSLVVTLAFGVLGMLVNLPRLTIFTGAALWFGGIFHLMAALLFGPMYGAIAALLTVIPCALLWGRPETACIVVAEAVTVGWLARRRMHPTLAELVFWIVIGTPMAALIYIVILSYPSPADWVMVVKHPVNGLLNVMIAELLISIPALQRLWGAAPSLLERKPLRTYLSHGFLLVATVPLLVLEYREWRKLRRAPGERGGGTSSGGGYLDAPGLGRVCVAASTGGARAVAFHHAARPLRPGCVEWVVAADSPSLWGLPVDYHRQRGWISDRRGSAGSARARKGAQQQAGRRGARQRDDAGSGVFPARQGITPGRDFERIYQPRGPAANGSRSGADFHSQRRAVWRDCGNAGSISFRATGENLRNAGPGSVSSYWIKTTELFIRTGARLIRRWNRWRTRRW